MGVIVDGLQVLVRVVRSLLRAQDELTLETLSVWRRFSFFLEPFFLRLRRLNSSGGKGFFFGIIKKNHHSHKNLKTS